MLKTESVSILSCLNVLYKRMRSASQNEIFSHSSIAKFITQERVFVRACISRAILCK